MTPKLDIDFHYEDYRPFGGSLPDYVRNIIEVERSKHEKFDGPLLYDLLDIDGRYTDEFDENFDVSVYDKEGKANLIKKKERVNNGHLTIRRLFLDQTLEHYPSLKDAFQNVLGKLTSKEYKALKLFFYKKMKPKKIADQMRISRSSVRTHLVRGLKKIITKLEHIDNPHQISYKTKIKLKI